MDTLHGVCYRPGVCPSVRHPPVLHRNGWSRQSHHHATSAGWFLNVYERAL